MSDETTKTEPDPIDRTSSPADLKAAADELLKADRAAAKAAADTEHADPDEEHADAAGTSDEAPDPMVLARELAEENNDLQEKLLRARAEMENIRKRSEREKADAKTYAVEKFAADLLSVSDNLSRALEALPESERSALTDSGKGLLGGIEMTHKELHTVLSRHGVTVIEAEPGAAFDPNLHQAVANIPSEHPNGTIASLFQSGWRIGDRTLRAAMVAVSAGESTG